MTDQTKSALELLRSSVFPDPASRAAYQFQFALAESEWAAPHALEQLQLPQLKSLAAFAAREAPYWRARIDTDAMAKAETLDGALSLLPVLTRADLISKRAAIDAVHLPPGHGIVGEAQTSGSTGATVAIRATNIAIGARSALALRSHLWAGRDFSRPFAIIRRYARGTAEYPDALELPRWDGAAGFPFPTGHGLCLNTHNASLEQQWDWLKQTKPAYLQTYPSIVRGFAERAVREGNPPALESIVTIGEVVDGELRELAARHLKARIQDIYASQEAGSMAIQCPEHPVLHVQAESVVLEILNERGGRCAVGETGRVVVTPLVNYATPLFRYEIGDYAEMGGACACGRGLPVLNRILGRRRNLLVLPDGWHFWPSLGARRMTKVVPVREYQVRQIAPDAIEVLLVTDMEIGEAQAAELENIVADGLPAKFDIRIRRVPEIPRPPSGKHEEFVSLVAGS